MVLEHRRTALYGTPGLNDSLAPVGRASTPRVREAHEARVPAGTTPSGVPLLSVAGSLWKRPSESRSTHRHGDAEADSRRQARGARRYCARVRAEDLSTDQRRSFR